jgi:hypothetical protein
VKTFIIILALAAIGGAGVWGLAQSTEVRGETAMPAVLHAVPAAGAVPSGQDLARYLNGLREADYTTYTHPVYGFSFAYPRAFTFVTTQTMHLDETFVRHPRLPLAISINVRPIEGSEASETLVASVTSLPADYDAEPPEGADGGAVALMAQDDPYPGQYTRYFWFAYQDHLYEIQMHAPDRELLEPWARQFLYTDFTLPAQ